MKHRQNSRAGFTLIELLVVIAIIAVLVSLLGAGIFYAYSTMRRTGTASDMSQLAAAMQSFKTQYKGYPPDQFRLCSNRGQYGMNGTNALDQASLAFINKMWPNIGNFQNQDWSGNGFAANGSLNVVVNEILDGDQSLVFFLGGVPSPGNGSFNFTGFSNDPKNPGLLPGFAINPATGMVIASTNAPGRVNAFFNFPSSRVKLRTDPITGKAKSTNFSSFWDYYQNSVTLPSGALEPTGFYLYFSGNNVKNGYNAFYPNNFTYTINVYNTTPSTVGPFASVQAYCQVAPVVAGGTQTSRGQYYSPDTFQILSAGKDGNFGVLPNGVWPTPPPPPLPTPAMLAGQDDLGSFNNNGVLAAPQ